MFTLLTKTTSGLHLVRLTPHASQLRLMTQYSNFSIFGSIFGKKEEKKEVKEEKVVAQKEQVQEPTKYHKESVKKMESSGEDEDIKQRIRQLDRTGGDNLYGMYKKQRKTIKEKNTNLEQHLHPDLTTNPRVSIEKYENNKFKRGLGPDETPFPQSPKIGPYLVEKPIFGAKNYFYCSCGLSTNQPFCDSSHKGTAFKPLKFSLDEKSERLHLCGCKLTTQAPFCDGQTCKRLVSGEPFDAAESLYAQSQEAEKNTPSSQP